MTDETYGVLIDYAMPLIRVEKLAKEVHDLCLHNKMPQAEEKAMELVAESRILVQMLRIMMSGR